MPQRTYTIEVNTFKLASILVVLASVGVYKITPDYRWLLGLVTVFSINTVLTLSYFEEDRLAHQGWMTFVCIMFLQVVMWITPPEGYFWLHCIVAIGFTLTFPEGRARWSQLFARTLQWIKGAR